MINTAKAIAEQRNWQAAHEWHHGLALIQHGVDIGECMTYDVLRVLGRLTQEEIQQEAKNGERQTDPVA